ncbi:MAG: hypothetical protein LBV16_05620 [Elusimicrobiota bacterium]|jgi:hypothetical protein|nr:hypothetical protein [Elusimicrobiota bacterium]
MKEKDKSLIQLLIEETGCEQNEAEVALSLSNHNLKEAVNKITSFLRVITAFKIKLIFPQENIYGLIHIVINKKFFEILKFNIVFSHNPAIYEISSKMDWFSFEKAIFSARLSDGAMEDYTKSVEEPFKNYITQDLKNLKLPSKETIENFFAPAIVNINILSEELNLSQFKGFHENETNNQSDYLNNYKDFEILKLDSEICQDEQGISAKKLRCADEVLSIITDKRDIAHYLIHLIGGIKNGELTPIPSTIKEMSLSGDYIEIYLQYAPSITGYTKIKKDTQVKRLSSKSAPLWEKIISKLRKR